MACRNILIIEDDDDIRNSLREILKAEGYEVSTARNGEEGLQYLEKAEPPCLVLLDMMMPVMDGIEFLKVKNTKTSFAPIPVVVVSAAVERAKDVANQVAGFIRKPIDLAPLLTTISAYCQHS